MFIVILAQQLKNTNRAYLKVNFRSLIINLINEFYGCYFFLIKKTNDKMTNNIL